MDKSTKKPRLLIVSYWFPPAGGIPVQRALSLVRYLPALGVEVHVLAPPNPPAPQSDPGLLQLIPPEAKVHRAFMPLPPSRIRQWMQKRLSGKTPAAASAAAPSHPAAPGWKSRLSAMLRQRFLSPDPAVVWTPFAKRKARQIVRKYGIDTIMVTAPPFSSFLVTTAIAQEFPHLKLISDFRDDWLRFFLGTFTYQKGAPFLKKAQRIERETVERSNHVVVVTDLLLEETRKRYPEQPAQKFVCIPNGFDPVLFADFQARPHGRPGFVVVYFGTVYSATSPKPYLDALDGLPAEIRSQVETRFVGRIDDDQRPCLENRGSQVTALGFIPQKTAVRHMEEADYLLVAMTDPTATTGKIYEYLATGKPILAIAPPRGEIGQLLRQTQAGWCADPDDPAAVAALLQEAFAPSRALIGTFHPDRKAIQLYERPRLAARFRDLMIS